MTNIAVAVSHPLLSPEPCVGLVHRPGHYAAQHAAPATCCGGPVTAQGLAFEDARSGDVYHVECLLAQGWTVAPCPTPADEVTLDPNEPLVINR